MSGRCEPRPSGWLEVVGLMLILLIGLGLAAIAVAWIGGSDLLTVGLFLLSWLLLIYVAWDWLGWEIES